MNLEFVIGVVKQLSVRMKKGLFILALPLLAAGCAHTIGYRLTEQDRWTGPKIEGVVCVEPFVDLSAPMPEEEQNGEETWRTNYRGHYRSANLTAQVTAMIVKHLAYSGLFTKVVSGAGTRADWFLSGTLTDFQAQGRVNHEAESIQTSLAGFGLLGGVLGDVATYKMTSEIRTRVTLSDLNLADKTGRSVWHDSISIDTDTNLYFGDAGRYAIFNFPDFALKDAVNQMIHSLGTSFATNHLSVAAH